MNFKRTSRKDDLQSLVYLLISLLRGDLFLENISEECNAQMYKDILFAKMKESQIDMCRDQAACLKRFAYAVNQIGFTDTPDYTYLKE